MTLQAGRVHQRARVLGEARAAEAGTGRQELQADALVEAHAAGHVLDVGSHLLAEIGQLVDEGDAGSEEGVGGVLDDLGGLAGGDEKRHVLGGERTVELAHHLLGALGIDADHHAVRPQEVLHRGTLAHELRVGCDLEVAIGPGPRHDLAQLCRGANRHGRLGDDDGEALHGPGDFLACRIDEGQIRRILALTRGRAHRDQHHIRLGNGVLHVVGEDEPARRAVGRHDGLQPLLVNRDPAALEKGKLAGITVHAGHFIAEVREAGSRNQPHIACADDRDLHRMFLPTSPASEWRGL